MAKREWPMNTPKHRLRRGEATMLANPPKGNNSWMCQINILRDFSLKTTLAKVFYSSPVQ
jgi:hypothetical protein